MTCNSVGTNTQKDLKLKISQYRIKVNWKYEQGMAELRLVSTESRGTCSTSAKRCTITASSSTQTNRKAIFIKLFCSARPHIWETNRSAASAGQKYFLSSLKHSTPEQYPVLAAHKARSFTKQWNVLDIGQARLRGTSGVLHFNLLLKAGAAMGFH